MSNLVPERRLDKNGVLSTKWVRPVEASTSSSTIPAPSSPKTIVEDWESLGGTPVDEAFTNSNLYVQSKYSIMDFDYEALCAGNDLVQQGVELGRAPMRTFNEAYRLLNDPEYVGCDPFLVMNDLAVFGAVLYREDSLADDVPAVVRGVKHHLGGEWRDYLHGATDEERRVAIALAIMLSHLEDNYVDVSDPYGFDITITMRSSEMVEYVKAHPDDAFAIARTVNERRSDDVWLLKSVLEADEKALRDGVL